MFASLRLELKGYKTIVWARLLVVLGVLGTLLSSLTGDQLSVFLPDKYKPFVPLILTFVGIVTEALRRITTGPVGQKGDDPPPANTKAGD